jgi:hypothetical protein
MGVGKLDTRVLTLTARAMRVFQRPICLFANVLSGTFPVQSLVVRANGHLLPTRPAGIPHSAICLANRAASQRKYGATRLAIAYARPQHLP